MKKKRHIAALAAAGLVLLACPGNAGAAGGIVQDGLTPSTAKPELPVAATLKAHASQCTTATRVGVSVRDALWNKLDYSGTAENVQICPDGFTFTTEPRTFPAGTYTQFGWYVDDTGYHELKHVQFTVTGKQRITHRAVGKRPVWAEEFKRPIAWGKRWTNTGTSAYKDWSHNPDDGKLDRVNPRNVSVAGGFATFTARPGRHKLRSGKRAWDTGLITTEGSKQGFRVRTGDYIETRVKLPSAIGAWPSFWTWKDGEGEVDVFEYHTDKPGLLEQCNHVRYAANFHKIRPPRRGEWTRIGVAIGEESVDWYVNDVLIYQDGRGVPRDWSAYLIMNLSVSAGTWHSAPQNAHPITFKTDYIRVHR